MEGQRAKKKKIFDDPPTCRRKSDEIPLDLMLEILKASPVKTLVRFLSVSKQFPPIIRNRDFMKSYLLKSSPPQSLMFTFQGSGRHFFFSTVQPQDPVESSPSSPSSTAIYHMSSKAIPNATVAPSVHGLIFHGPPSKPMVYNPSTRRSITLPKIDTRRISTYHHLGYDPIDGDYKVLWMARGRMHVKWGFFPAEELRVLTLGNGNSWRMIEDFPPHCICLHDTPDICINGVLYYVAVRESAESHVVVTFDVRSEKFDLIEGPNRCVLPKMTRYEGKPALLFCGVGDGRINLWVLEDAAKHKWSKKWYGSAMISNGAYFDFQLFCVNDAGEIVLAPRSVGIGPFYVLYFHPEKNYVRRAYIEGISRPNVPLWNEDEYHDIVSIFTGQVDNLMFL